MFQIHTSTCAGFLALVLLLTAFMDSEATLHSESESMTTFFMTESMSGLASWVDLTPADRLV